MLIEQARALARTGMKKHLRVLPMYAGLPSFEQMKVFERVSHSVRKVRLLWSVVLAAIGNHVGSPLSCRMLSLVCVCISLCSCMCVSVDICRSVHVEVGGKPFEAGCLWLSPQASWPTNAGAPLCFLSWEFWG